MNIKTRLDHAEEALATLPSPGIECVVVWPDLALGGLTPKVERNGKTLMVRLPRGLKYESLETLLMPDQMQTLSRNRKVIVARYDKNWRENGSRAANGV